MAIGEVVGRRWVKEIHEVEDGDMKNGRMMGSIGWGYGVGDMV